MKTDFILHDIYTLYSFVKFLAGSRPCRSSEQRRILYHGFLNNASEKFLPKSTGT